MKSFIALLFFCLINGLLTSCDRHEQPQFNGYVEADNIYLASPFYGVLQQLAVVRGQAVKKGQLLVHLNPDPQALALMQSAAELKQAQSMFADMIKPKRPPEIDAIKAQIAQTESRIKLAELRADRYNKLFRRNATDKDSMDAADTNLQQEEDAKAQYEANLMLAQLGSREDQIAAQGAQVDALKAKLNITRWELAQKTLVAPTDGIIFDIYYRQGEYVAAQQAVLALLAPENMYLEFFVPLKFLAQIKPGQKIHFTCEGCAPNNQAEINYISPTAEYLPPLVYSRDNSSKLVFRIKARMQQPQHFKTGQPVTVTI